MAYYDPHITVFFNTYISLYTRSWKPKIFLLKRVDSEKGFEKGESGKFEIPPCRGQSFWKDGCFSWRSPWIIHRQSVHRYLPRFSALSFKSHELSMTIPLFFHNRRVSSFCESHFFSPFWWRSFRRFCPLVICTETASRFERGPKHVAQRWGIEADGFVGKCVTKTFKPHQEMCKTSLFQSVFSNKMFFLFVVWFFLWMPKENTNLECHQFQRIPPQIRCVDLVEWHRKLVMKNMAMKDFTLGVLPWKLTCLLKINGWKMYSLLK